MTEYRHLLTRRLACLAMAVVVPPAANAQTTPRRLELADSARSAPPAAPKAPAVALTPEPRSPGGPAAGRKDGESVLHGSFVRDQTVLGLLAYGPSFATAVTREPVAWSATLLVVAGGTYFTAAQLSRDLAINGPTGWLATQAAVRGGLTGWAIAYAADADRHSRAGATFLGAIGGAAGAVAFGRGMSDGEVAASVFGADLLALSALGATHIVIASASDRARAGTIAAAGVLGYPLGHWYASRASYHVSAGDVNTLWTSAAIGATAASAFIAAGHPSRGSIAATLVAGALTGTILGDRFLVRRHDHSPEDGQMVALGAAAGGLTGAGIGILSGVAHEQISPASAAFTAAGAVGGVIFAERLRAPRGDAGRKLARLELNTAGAIAVAAGATGNHTLLRWTF
jgi:hypothetical protein